MSDQFSVFEDGEFEQVRTAVIDGELWFMASDVCGLLDISNPSQAVSRLGSDDRALISNECGRPAHFVNESGLCSLVLSCRKQKAKDFKRWVTHEVIPSVLRYGAYMTPSIIDRVVSDPDAAIKLAAQLKEVQVDNTIYEENSETRQGVELHNQSLDSVKSMNATELASSLGLKSAKELNKWLCALGVIKKVGHNGQYALTAKYSDKGYAISLPYRHSGECTDNLLCYTQCGRKMIYELFVKVGLIDPQLVPLANESDDGETTQGCIREVVG